MARKKCYGVTEISSVAISLQYCYETIHKICDYNKDTIQVLKRISVLKMKSDTFKDPQTEREDEDGNDFMLLRPTTQTQDTSDSNDSSEE